MTSTPSERWYTAADLAGLAGLPGTERNVRARAEREGWASRPRVGRGGGSEYAFNSLPQVTQAAILLRERPAEATAPRRNKLAPSDAHLQSAWQRYE